jgi:hypothetical protein
MRAWWVLPLLLALAASLPAEAPAKDRIGLGKARVVKRAWHGPGERSSPSPQPAGLQAAPLAGLVSLTPPLPPPVEEPPSEEPPPVEEPPVEEPPDEEPPDEEPPPVEEPPPPPPYTPPPCTQHLSPGADLVAAIEAAGGGAVICLDGGSWSFDLTGVDNAVPVTVRSADETVARVSYSLLAQSSGLQFSGLEFTGGVEVAGASDHIEFLHNELTGPFGIRANGEQQSEGTVVTDVTIEANYIHDLDYTGSQGTANGYGVTAVNGVERFTIAYNTIKSTASDYLQSASPVDFSVERNTFLGPSLLGEHEDHQDLWQIFGGGENITFAGNVARNTQTQESLLFQEGAFSNVVVENNLFDHDSRGYTCQIYQSTGLVFRRNTVVGSHWGCLFRDLASSPEGSGYHVDHNIFAATEASADISTEGRAEDWGTYDYNVSSDESADGAHSIRQWSPTWQDMLDYVPTGSPLALGAGYRP